MLFAKRPIYKKLDELSKLLLADANDAVPLLLNLYLSSDGIDKDFIRKKLSYKAAGKLLVFGREMVLKATQTKNSDFIVKGLTAQSIENARVDYNDNVEIMRDLSDAARSIGCDPVPLLTDLMKISSAYFSAIISKLIEKEALRDAETGSATTFKIA
jgi:hypothetical protein